MSNGEVDRIRGDLAKAKQRLSEMQAGQHVYGAETGIPLEMAGRAFASNQGNLYATIQRLESELVQTMIGCKAWSPGEIIQRMEQS